jgi:regulation of enolase protein 1 (concanavalin A-like superfamily)
LVKHARSGQKLVKNVENVQKLYSNYQKWMKIKIEREERFRKLPSILACEISDAKEVTRIGNNEIFEIGVRVLQAKGNHCILFPPTPR